MKAIIMVGIVFISASIFARESIEETISKFDENLRCAANYTIKPCTLISSNDSANILAEESGSRTGANESEDNDATEDFALYIPNSFTPNNDGLNDLFTVYGHGIREFEMSIYSRWGDMLYTGNENSKGWNGTFKNIPCGQATYIYIIEYVTLAGFRDTKKGHLTIIR
jgi:gliding motility-associated-like protein